MPDNSLITPAQMKRLQTLMAKLAIKDSVPKAAHREWRLAWVGRRVSRDIASFKDLTKAEAAAALELLAKEIPGQPRSRRASGPEAGRAGRRSRVAQPPSAVTLVSGASLDTLATLKNALGWNQDRFAAFARRQLRGRYQIRTEADANKIIWPLKQFLRRGQRLNQKQTLEPENDRAAESSVAAGLSACSGCSGPVDGDPHGRDKGEEEKADSSAPSAKSAAGFGMTSLEVQP